MVLVQAGALQWDEYQVTSFFEDGQMCLDLDRHLLTINCVPVYPSNQRDEFHSYLLFVKLEEREDREPWELVNICKVLL